MRKMANPILRLLFVLFLINTLFLCNDPIKPQFTIPVIGNNKQIQAIGQDIVDSTFSLYIAALGTGPLTFQWQKDGAPVSDFTKIVESDTLHFPTLSIAHSGSYRCIVSNTQGSDTSAAYALQVVVAPTIIKEPEARSASIGDSITFSVIATGTTLQYQWYKDTSVIDSAIDSSYTTPALSLADDSASYWCIAFNKAGKDTSTQALLTIEQTYSVTYDGNGNSGGVVPTDLNAYETGATVSVLDNTGHLTKNGFNFTGWNTKADGSGVFYPVNTTFTMGVAPVVLYAQWEPGVTFSITYHGNGHTTGAVPVDTNAYTSGSRATTAANTGILGKTGHTFVGWNTEADGSGIQYPVGTALIIGNADIALYAQWTTARTFRILYDGNGNTGGLPPTDLNNYVAKAVVNVLGNSGNLSKTGCTFLRWNTAADGSGINYIAGDTVIMDTTNIVLFAQWTTNATYTITYDANGASAGQVPIDGNNYLSGDSVTVPGNIGNLVKPGSTFTGWNTVSDGSGTPYLPGATLIIAQAPVILYAQWTVLPTYSVTYKGNGNTGGTVPIDANQYTTGMTVTIMGNTGNLIKANVTFAGWNTQADGSGTNYSIGATFIMGNADVVLYAKWTQNPTYQVLYEKNGATSGLVPVDANNYEKGDSVSVLGNTGNLALTGFTFAGWNTAADGSGIDYAAGARFAMDTVQVTLFAKWTNNPTYTITYQGNGNSSGSVPIDANNYEVGAVVTVLANTGNLAKTGYFFTGWNTVADGSGTLLQPADIFFMGAAHDTLYAQWIRNQTFTVTYLGNGSTGGAPPVDTNNYTEGATVLVLSNSGNLSKAGYTFAGWNAAPDGSGTTHQPTTTFSMGPANDTLYALWALNPTYTITYIGNGNTSGTAAVDTNTYEVGEIVTVLGNTGSLAKTGFIFAGWNAAADGSGTTHQPTTTFTMGTTNDTLYAIWSIIPTFEVTVSPVGNGAVAPAGVHHIPQGGQELAVTATPALGHHFVKWEITGNIIIVDSTTAGRFTILGDGTISAHFAINTYTITCASSGNGTVAPTGRQVITYDSLLAVTATPAEGYHFLNWTVSGGIVIEDSSITGAFRVTDTGTIAAHFEINGYTVTFKAGSNGSINNLPEIVQQVNHGASCTTMTPIPSLGYHFTDWRGDYAGVDNPLTLPNVTKDMTLIAYFAVDTLTVRFQADANGSITGDTIQKIIYGNSCTEVVATPNTGYHFTDWTGHSSQDSALIVTNVTSDMTISANFAINTYTVTFKAGVNGSVDDLPEVVQTVNHGANATPVLAKSAIGYHFTDWRGDVTSTDNPLTISNVISDMTVFAYFAIDTLTVTFRSSGSGSLLGDTIQEVMYGGSCAEVQAVSNIGHHFHSWTGHASTDTALTVSGVTSNMTITANFAIDTFTVTFLAGTNGSLVGNTSQRITYQGNCSEVQAASNTGYHFDSWTGHSSTDSALTVTNVTADQTITANFAINVYSVTFNANSNGTVNSQSQLVQQIEHGANCDPVTATGSTGYHFYDWRGDYVGTTNPLTITNVTSDMTINGYFAIDTFTVTFAAGSNGSLVGTKTQRVTYGGSCSQVRAIPNSTYKFSSWTGHSSTDSALTVTNVTSNMSITANFTKIMYTVTLTAEYHNGPCGTVSPALGTYQVLPGASFPVSISGTSHGQTGCALEGWFVGGTNISTSESYTFTINNSMTIVAKIARW